MEKYIVDQGECISSIAYEYGFFPDTLWNLAENAELKQKRKDPNVLFQGDEVFIPDKREKTESGATEQRHRFRKKTTPAKLRLRLLDENNEPRANVTYQLLIEGQWFNGTTNSNGMLEHTIPPNSRTGMLLLENEGSIPLDLGELDPWDTDSGVKQRLKNLGYDCGPDEEGWSEECVAALKKFQESQQGLNVTGQADQATRDKLLQVHGS
jgi:hypothetical protein